MHLYFRNINEAFHLLVSGVYSSEIKTEVTQSRNGEVLVIPEPVTITYEYPRERVLFNRSRDCNPFFHLYEALWMLAGRNDVESVAYYASNMKNYSDNGKTFNGAYGHRWHNGGCWAKKNGYNLNQLDILIKHLKKDPHSRRAVLQMWNVEDDLLKIDNSKDVCCNTSCYFLITFVECSACNGIGGDRAGTCRKCLGEKQTAHSLDMTVMNRSNDMIWGSLGANAVHFSFLQEYMADCLGLQVGVYNQISNNLHVYTDNWNPEEWLKEYKVPQQRTMFDSKPLQYKGDFTFTPLVKDKEVFDEEVKKFVDQAHSNRDMKVHWQEPFLQNVAFTMNMAFKCHKDRDYKTAKTWMALVENDDWRIAGLNWINKRQKNWEAKNASK